MEKYAITPGDFLKNAGIVGLKYILDCAKAQEGVDFGISKDGQEMWLNYELYHVTITNDWYFIKIFVALIVYSDRHHVWCKKSTKHGKSQEGIEIKYV